MQNSTVATPDRARNNSSSLRRALAILQLVGGTAGRSHGASLAELAEGVATTKSTVLRLLAPLLEARLVRQDADGGYRVGVGVLSLAGAYLNDLDVRSVANPILREIAADTGQTAHLLVYSDGRVTYVDKVAGDSPIQMASRVGDTGTAYSTASGKAMLAYLGEEEFRRVVALGMPARTPETITNPDVLRERLATVRETGVAYDDLENEDGIRCVAAPVFNHAGVVVAAVSTSGPADLILANRERYTELIVESARRISRELGFQGGHDSY